jgi:Fur family transcriptional regulator, ferric uptake regulator
MHDHHHQYDHEHAREVLRQAGYKLTTPRMTILDLLSENGGHLTSSDLLRLVEERDPGIGRASVFRTLDLFARLGLVASTVRGATISYVLLFGGHHHHMICTRCQKLIEFEDCRLGFLTALLREEYGFHHEGHMLEVYGMCRECYAMQQAQANQPVATPALAE